MNFNMTLVTDQRNKAATFYIDRVRFRGLKLAPRLTMEDRLQRLVAKCRSRVDALESPPVSLSHTPDSTLGRLAREAGYDRVSDKFCELLTARLEDAYLVRTLNWSTR